ncbi:hypothetical protein lbkm_1952 [Lachnospiraceae bacterium KM106-2]|nr:hypothetical protein lbkm_1952 [Lachnospiraceae bacterium KM106-2]
MDEMYKQVDGLIDLIKSSSEYLDYTSKLKQIQGEDALSVRFDEFRKKRFTIQLNDDAQSQKELKVLYQEYKDVVVSPLVCDFLLSEEKLFKTLRNLNSYVVENLDISTGFLEG